MKIKHTLVADKGNILTNGEIYVRAIDLADGLTEEGFYEITEAEYQAKMAELEREAQI